MMTNDASIAAESKKKLVVFDLEVAQPEPFSLVTLASDYSLNVKNEHTKPTQLKRTPKKTASSLQGPGGPEGSQSGAPATIKRRRGRPRKVDGEPPKRQSANKRGRKPQNTDGNGDNSNPSKSGTPKKRGRPRKNPVVLQDNSEDPTKRPESPSKENPDQGAELQASRGQPSKVQQLVALGENNEVAKRSDSDKQEGESLSSLDQNEDKIDKPSVKKTGGDPPGKSPYVEDSSEHSSEERDSMSDNDSDMSSDESYREGQTKTQKKRRKASENDDDSSKQAWV